ncbi:MAG TPA: TonB-dependent receptor [Puia sp.]|jgi:iron complex outermembrane receptor protein|nr:TonB-dependent receptor [Puia sp.]
MPRLLIRIFLLLMLPCPVPAQSTQAARPGRNDTTPELHQLLDLSVEQLMNVKVVTAAGFPQQASQAPATITVITAQQIRERGYEQLEDALRDVPGIDMVHINGYAPTLIYFRGMYGAENTRALLMIDGIAENNILGSNDMAGPAYSLHDVERIEIVWGPVSALYGENAYGGVINIISKKGAQASGFHAEEGLGSYSTRFEKLNAGFLKGRWEGSVAGTLYYSQGPVFRNRDPYYNASFFDNAYSYKGELSYHGDHSTTTIGYRSYRTPAGWGTYSNSATTYFGLPPQGYKNLGLVGLVQRSFLGKRSGVDDPFLRTLYLQEDWQPGKNVGLTGRLTYRETGVAADSYILITTNGTLMQRIPILTTSNRMVGELSGHWQLTDRQQLAGGLSFFQDNVEKGERGIVYDPAVEVFNGKDSVTDLHPGFAPRAFDIRNNFGSYAQYVITTPLLHKTSWTAGARYDYNSYFGSAFSPRLAVVNEWNSKVTIKLQAGQAFRAPTNLEIYQTGRNFKLTTEKITSYEINAAYTPVKQVRIGVNFFRNELRDVIVLADLSGLNPDKNPGKIDIDGMEAVLNYQVGAFLTGWANFTWQDPRGKDLVTGASGQLPDVAAVKGNTGATVHFNRDLFLTLSENWVGKRKSPRTDPYGPVAGYALTNLVIGTTKLFDRHISASIDIHNLFNAKWLDPGFRTADGLVYATVLEQPGANAIIKLGITL